MNLVNIVFFLAGIEPLIMPAAFLHVLHIHGIFTGKLHNKKFL